MLDAASKDELKVSGVCVQRDDGTSGLRGRQAFQEGAAGVSTEVPPGLQPKCQRSGSVGSAGCSPFLGLSDL